jgi:methyl-accepting chemotaxis protein
MLTLLAISLVPITVLWLVARGALVDEATRGANSRLELAATTLKDRVNAWTGRGIDAMSQLTLMPAFRKMDRVQTQQMLKAAYKNMREWYLWHLEGPDGMDISRSDDEPLKYYGDREYFRESFFNDKMGKLVAIGKTSGKPALMFSVPVKSEMNTNVGVLVIAGALDDVTKAFADAKFGRTGIALLIDDDGKLIVSPKENIGGELKDYSKHPAYQAFKSGALNPVRYRDGNRDVVAYVMRSTVGFITVVQQDEEESLAAVRAADNFALVILGMTILVVIAAAWLLARNLATPIQDLTSVADHISRGALATKIVAAGRGDEIGALARSIERLSTSMSIAMERLRVHH